MMASESRSTGLEWLLVLIGAVDCVLVAGLFYQAQTATGDGASSAWPLPGLYLLEISLIGLVNLAARYIRNSHTRNLAGLIAWVSAGILLAFVILGAWTIGFFLIPGVAAFTAYGVIMDKRLGKPVSRQISLMFIAAASQATIIFLAVQ